MKLFAPLKSNGKAPFDVSYRCRSRAFSVLPQSLFWCIICVSVIVASVVNSFSISEPQSVYSHNQREIWEAAIEPGLEQHPQQLAPTAIGKSAATEDESVKNYNAPKAIHAQSICSAIDELLASSKQRMNAGNQDSHCNPSGSLLGSRGMGILGHPLSEDVPTLPPGSAIYETDTAEKTIVRVATPLDDFDIASLRVSVFSDFTLELQNLFRIRSCQALHNRRLRGAVCLVATMPDNRRSQHQLLVGSAECSFEEFAGTRLGQKRLPNSLLYVTEVAVNPSMRRRGVASKLMRAVDCLALARGAETLYLHVDTANKGAIAMYEGAGYRQVSLKSKVFMEFTTSLNLHPGATKGRDHYLLQKDMTTEPTWLTDSHCNSAGRKYSGSLGFTIPL
jgi:ribosomal protein S18 acetylase RimI-like enzyme